MWLFRSRRTIRPGPARPGTETEVVENQMHVNLARDLRGILSERLLGPFMPPSPFGCDRPRHAERRSKSSSHLAGVEATTPADEPDPHRIRRKSPARQTQEFTIPSLWVHECAIEFDADWLRPSIATSIAIVSFRIAPGIFPEKSPDEGSLNKSCQRARPFGVEAIEGSTA